MLSQDCLVVVVVAPVLSVCCATYPAVIATDNKRLALPLYSNCGIDDGVMVDCGAHDGEMDEWAADDGEMDACGVDDGEMEGREKT